MISAVVQYIPELHAIIGAVSRSTRPMHIELSDKEQLLLAKIKRANSQEEVNLLHIRRLWTDFWREYYGIIGDDQIGDPHED